MSELGDLEAIRRLTYEYAMAVDTMQLDKLIDLFVPEAVFDPGPGGVPVMNDRDEIEAFFKATFEGSRNLYHLTSNHIIDVDGDTASGTVYYAASGVTADSIRPSTARSFSASGCWVVVRDATSWSSSRTRSLRWTARC